MGKKTTTTKPAAPEKRAAKTKPATGKAEVIAPAVAKTTGTKPKRAASAKPDAKRTAKPAYSQDDIALRAYFIAERRQAAGLPGDAHQDWIEAERQLASEAGSTKKAKAKKS